MKILILSISAFISNICIAENAGEVPLIPGVALPFVDKSEDIYKLTSNKDSPWKLELPSRKFDLPAATGKITGLYNNRIIAVVAEDGLTVNLFDLKNEVIRSSFVESEPIGSIHGSGTNLILYLPQSESLRVRSLSTINQSKDWTPPVGNKMRAIGTSPSTNDILIMDMANRIHRLTVKSEINLVKSLDFLSLMKGQKPVIHETKEQKLWKLPVSEDLNTVFLPGIRINLGSRPSVNESPRFSSFTVSGLPIFGKAWSTDSGLIVDEKWLPLAKLKGLAGTIPGNRYIYTTLGYGSPSGMLEIIDTSTMNSCALLADLKELSNSPTHQDIPPTERIYFCPELNKIVILNGARNMLVIRDLDLDLLAKGFPRQTSLPLISFKGSRAISYTFSFNKPNSIEKYELSHVSNDIILDEKLGIVRWNPPDTKNEISKSVVVKAILKGGGVVHGIVTFYKPSSS